MTAKAAMPDYTTESYELPLEDAIELARGHHIAGNYVLAERTYKDVLKAAPDNPTVNHLLGALYFQLGAHENALEYMEKSIELAPDEMQYHSNYGGVLTVMGHYGEALATFDTVLKAHPDNLEALNRKAQALWKSEDYTTAIDVAKKAYDLDPKFLETLLNYGISLALAEKFEDAALIWQEASEQHPHDARVWSNLANMMRELKKPVKALSAIDKALELEPKNAEALNNKGCILRDLRRFEEALSYLTEATDILPNYPQAHYNKALTHAYFFDFYQASVAARYAVNFKDDYLDGYNALSSALVELGDLEQAHFAAQRAVQLNQNDPEAYLNLSDVLYLLNRFDDGFAALKYAVDLNPDDARCHLKIANIYERLDERDLAIDSINRALELNPDAPFTYVRKASILHVCNEIEESLACADKAIEMAPEMVMAYVTKAEALIAINEIEQAREVINKVRELDPENPQIFYTLSNLEKIKSEDHKDFQLMLSLQDKAQKMGKGIEAGLHFAIAGTYENIKDYDKAFEHYKKANDLRYDISPYDPELAKIQFEQIKANFPKKALQEAVAKKQGYDSDSPIFIVGMPRSGTTLTEQIISSHPDVYGAGELPDILRVKRKFPKIDEETAVDMGKLYVEYSRERIKGGDFKHVSDKMPGNYLHIGIIASILPNAKIIHCNRSPMDTCLSNYKQNFLMGQYWSYDLEEMAQEHLRYQDLMAYWHDALPGRILDINYEDTVDDLEAQARRLIDFIGLEWNDACLEPHKKKRAVLTASKMQVTQPVYKTSVKKWKKFEKGLQPLVRILDPDEALHEEA